MLLFFVSSLDLFRIRIEIADSNRRTHLMFGSHSEIEYQIASTIHCQWGYNYKFISTGRETAPNNQKSLN